MTSHRKLAGLIVALSLLSTPALAKNKGGNGNGKGCDSCYNGPYPTVDTCAGGDLHINFGINPEYAINVVTVSKEGTYPGTADGEFGCPNDNANTLLGNASVVDETYNLGTNTPSGVFTVERTSFNFTSGPQQGQIVLDGDVPSGLAGNGCGAAVDVPVSGGSGAFAGITGVAHVTAIPGGGPECQVQFAPR
ncbi:MAG: hypothetical protein WBQ86_06810 [Candidatus Binatus sp.]